VTLERRNEVSVSNKGSVWSTMETYVGEIKATVITFLLNTLTKIYIRNLLKRDHCQHHHHQVHSYLLSRCFCKFLLHWTLFWNVLIICLKFIQNSRLCLKCFSKYNILFFFKKVEITTWSWELLKLSFKVKKNIYNFLASKIYC